MKKTLFITLILFALACNKKQEKISNTEIEGDSVFFDPINLGSSGSKENLEINSFFSECGEWGGHSEKMIIYATRNEQFYLNYEKTKIDCNKRDNKGVNIQTVILKKTIKLNTKEKKAITNYMQRMVLSKLAERFPGNSGNEFSIIKSDSTFVIDVYDSNDYNLKSYNELLSELKLPKLTTSGKN